MMLKLVYATFYTALMFTSTYLTANSLTKDTLSSLDKQLKANELRYGTVSQSILVKKQNHVIYDIEHGLSSIELGSSVNRQSQYPVYSLAKLFASVSVMSLVEQEKLNLDESIRFYLPELPSSWSHVTVRNCLNHTSGLPEYFSLEFVQTGFPKTAWDAIERISGHSFQFKTKSNYNYNNTNFIILGLIVEHLTNLSYLEFVDKTVIQPLGLKNTFFAQAKQVIPNLVSSYWGSAGEYSVDKGVDWATYSFTHSGLYSNKNDLLRFIEGVLAGKVLSRETLFEMWQPVVLNDGSIGGFASGWQFTQEGEFVRVGHEGGNRVRLDYHFKPSDIDDNYTSIYLTNGNAFSGITTHLVDSLMSIIAPSQFPTLVLLEKMLDGAFNNTLHDSGNDIVLALDRDPFIGREKRARFMMERGWTVLFNSYPNNAVTFYEFYTQFNPEDAHGWRFLADAWLALGDKTKATSLLQKALSIAPNNNYIAKKLAGLKEESK